MEELTNNYTELVFILDRSGSMHGLETDTIGGFNSVLDEHKKMEGEAFVTTVLFNDQTNTVKDRENIKEVIPLTSEDYHVGGCTALLDALGNTIDRISNIQKVFPKHHQARSIVFVIITDGLENASTHYDYPQVKKMIERKQEESWEFVFMGANIDAIEEASKLGIQSDHAVEYWADKEGTAAAFEAMTLASCSIRECGMLGDSWAAAIEEDKEARE